MNSTAIRDKSRSGFTLVELVVASAVLTSIITLMTTLTVKIGHVWKDMGHCRVAIAELNNQLDRLTRMEPRQAEEAIRSLQPSEYCQRTLSNPHLSAQIVPTEIGLQLTLQLKWQRRSIDKPMQMTGWIIGKRQAEEFP